MTISMVSTDVQKNFGKALDEAIHEPLKITRHGREVAYLLSARQYHELLSRQRKAPTTYQMTDKESDLMMSGELPHDYEYETGH